MQRQEGGHHGEGRPDENGPSVSAPGADDRERYGRKSRRKRSEANSAEMRLPAEVCVPVSDRIDHERRKEGYPSTQGKSRNDVLGGAAPHLLKIGQPAGSALPQKGDVRFVTWCSDG